MTKHVRKEHPADSVHDDQDADYSDLEASEDDLEDESDEIKEESQSLYQESMDAKKMHLGRQPSEYSRNLWRLPGQTAHRPSPLHLQSSTVPGSEVSTQDIKLERTSSVTPRRSMTDPYPDSPMSSHEFSLARANTIPNDVVVPSTRVQQPSNGSLPPQYRLRTADNVGLWNPQHALQESPTSLSQSSPQSATSQPHPSYTSQPYQFDSMDVSNESLQYPHRQEVLVGNALQQPLNDLTVHEIHLEPQPQVYRDMASTPVHQNPFDAGIQQHVSEQEAFISMSREVSHYQDDVPPTPASTQQLPHYTTSLAETPYAHHGYVPVSLGSFSASNQVFPPDNGVFQYNHAMDDWWKADKLQANGYLLPNQRVQDFNSYGA